MSKIGDYLNIWYIHIMEYYAGLKNICLKRISLQKNVYSKIAVF